ncbi:OLC1v1034896C1 [Oldenlandia corymbosa var. corymbosa]|uniref:OLC1v1034896C1 n=1 Tax=Oldenlandia corymbosa var. corymbosa TaxID=529605 RepID=A0AAV1CRU4_OLDCO|nr:OLC1v1034896C1 [Oldenlandia corymbosa var. corymbosa]
MSQHQESLHDPLKPWKYILFSPFKLTDATAKFMKAVFLVCFVTSISLVSYSFFSTTTTTKYFRCAGFDDHSVIHAAVAAAPADIRPPGGDPLSTNISHLLFGIGGSVTTWDERRKYNEIWWEPNVTRGFVWLDETPTQDATWPETSPPYKVSADTSSFKYTCGYGSRSAIRIARIVKESFELGLDNVRWFVMGDDDTVFFPENLLTVLRKYDHNEMYYVGGVSESVEQAIVHSYTMGYGGAGFAISYALAAELVKILDGCIDRYASFYGSDQKIGGCIMEIGVPLTREPGFHQVDIRGGPYGLLAAHPLAPLVSLHHLDSVQPIFPEMDRVDSVKTLVKAYESDPSRALQHTFCYDLKRNWSISISWGYTVQLYPTLLTAQDLATPVQTFLTWKSWAPEPFTFNTRANTLDPCERPVVYYFDGVDRKSVKGVETTTSSYSRPPQSVKQCEKDIYEPALAILKFNVTAAILHPDTWKKAPRRQCCEIINGGKKDNVVQIKIRDCKPWESVTLPIIVET